MKGSRKQEISAFSLIEVLVILVVAGLLAVGFIFLGNAKARAIRMACVNNLKQCGIAFTVWSGDNGGRFPMEVSKEQGGALGWPPEGNAFRNFQVMSNELSTAYGILCPADTREHATNNLFIFNNQNVSYFIGLDAATNNPSAWLCGDRNITNTSLSHSVLIIGRSQSVRWTHAMHKNCGNVTLVDGSVHQWSDQDLRNVLNNAPWTNRLVLPE